MSPDGADAFKFLLVVDFPTTTGRITSEHPALSRPPGKSRSHEALWALRSLIDGSGRNWTHAEAQAIREDLLTMDYGAMERRVLAMMASRPKPKPVDQMMCWFDEAASFTHEARRKLGRLSDRDLARFEKERPAGEFYEAVRWALREMGP